MRVRSLWVVLLGLVTGMATVAAGAGTAWAVGERWEGRDLAYQGSKAGVNPSGTVDLVNGESDILYAIEVTNVDGPSCDGGIHAWAIVERGSDTAGPGPGGTIGDGTEEEVSGVDSRGPIPTDIDYDVIVTVRACGDGTSEEFAQLRGPVEWVNRPADDPPADDPPEEGTPPADTTAPSVGRRGISPRSGRYHNRGPRIWFRPDEAASGLVALQRCERLTRNRVDSERKRRRCAKWKTIRRQQFALAAGERFSVRLRGLRRGIYRVGVIARDAAGNTARVAGRPFASRRGKGGK